MNEKLNNKETNQTNKLPSSEIGYVLDFDEIGPYFVSEESLLKADLLEKQLIEFGRNFGRNVVKHLGQFIMIISVVDFSCIGEVNAREMQKTISSVDFDSGNLTNFEVPGRNYHPVKLLKKKLKKIIFKPDSKLVQLVQDYTFLKRIQPVINLVELNNYRTNFTTLALPKIIDMSLKLPYQVIPTTNFSISTLLKIIKVGRQIFFLGSTTLIIVKLIRLRGGETLPQPNQDLNRDLMEYQRRRNRIKLILMSVFLTGSLLILAFLIYYGVWDLNYLFEKEEYTPTEVGVDDPVPALKRRFLEKMRRFMKNPEKHEELTKMSRGFEDYKQKYVDAVFKDVI